MDHQGLKEAALAMDAARVRLDRIRGMLAAILWRVEMRAVPGFGSAGMSRDSVLAYDPEWALGLDLDSRVGVIYHELMHWMVKHSERLEHLPDVRRANLAADLDVQDDLEDEIARYRDFALPKPYIVAGKTPFEGLPRNLLAEQYYELLEQMAQQGGGQDQGERRPDVMNGSCGSVAHGHDEPWEDPDDAAGISEAQARLIRRQLAEDIRREAARSSSIGNLPEWMKRWAEEQFSPKVHWTRYLDRWVRQSIGHTYGFQDYNWRVPNRRASLHGLLFPGLVKMVPSIAVVLDVSGSMDARQLGMAVSEVGGLLRDLGQTEGVWVLATDAQAHTCQRVFSKRQIQLVGGGGTILENGIERAMRIRPRPQLVICITDCHNYWRAQRPRGVDVIIVRIGTGNPPAWARRVIDVDETHAMVGGGVW